MAKLVVDKASLVSVAEAIRTKGNTTDDLQFPNGFVDAVNAIESGGGGGNWYDFTVTLTSDIANGAELLEALSPYLTDIRQGKDVAICSLLNADIAPTTIGGGVAIWCAIQYRTDGKMSGYVSRYRSATNLIATAEMSTNYACSALAGYKYHIKVVNVLA